MSPHCVSPVYTPRDPRSSTSVRNSRNAPPWHFFPSARLRLVRANQNSLRKELLAERRHAWFSARGRINFVNEWPPCEQTNQPDGNWNNVRGYVCAHVKFLNVSLILRIWRRKMSKPFLVCPSLFVRDGIFILRLLDIRSVLVIKVIWLKLKKRNE